jgi:hypothetical protein
MLLLLLPDGDHAMRTKCLQMKDRLTTLIHGDLMNCRFMDNFHQSLFSHLSLELSNQMLKN